MEEKLYRCAEDDTPSRFAAAKIAHTHGIAHVTAWQDVRFAFTGDIRWPKKGEWFLSGAIPEAYLSNGLETMYYRIVKPVGVIERIERLKRID